MLAMLQQFYMTPAFRYAILMADDDIPPNVVDAGRYGDNVDDNILHQFQRMFGFLDLSDRQDFDPAPFCFSFKDWNGNPVNMAIQQDAQEFLNMVFDKLENGIKETPYKQFMEGVYGGKKQYTTIC